jgi:endoglucanase
MLTSQLGLDTGGYCVLDIHNYGRWNGQIIGQSTGGPTDAQFADLWAQLATKYKRKSKVIFGLMNEPHDLNLSMWVTTLQLAVNAIRGVGAKSQWVLLPGLHYSSAGSMKTESGPTLLDIKNPDGSTKTLIFDVHQYLDSDFTGTHAECTTDNIQNVFNVLGPWLRSNKRLALLSETGGGNTASVMAPLLHSKHHH